MRRGGVSSAVNVFAERLANTLQPVDYYSTPIISMNRLRLEGKQESNFAIKKSVFLIILLRAKYTVQGH